MNEHATEDARAFTFKNMHARSQILHKVSEAEGTLISSSPTQITRTVGLNLQVSGSAGGDITYAMEEDEGV